MLGTISMETQNKTKFTNEINSNIKLHFETFIYDM